MFWVIRNLRGGHLVFKDMNRSVLLFLSINGQELGHQR